jgi:glucose/arabinose dehydrogenase
MNARWLIPAALLAAVGTALIAQPPAPPAGAPPAAGKAKGPGRGAPQWRLEKGLPIETRAPELSSDKPAFPGQWRAPYEPSGVALKVTTLTDKLQQPWGMAFLPDGKILITEKPGRLRTYSPDGTLSEPLSGLPAIHYLGQTGLLDVALDKNFAQNRRIFFAYAEPVGDTDSRIVVASATLNPAATAISGVKVIFASQPALNKQRFAAQQGGRIAIDRDGNLFVAIGDRSSSPPHDYAQRLDNTLGKIIHITPEGRPAPNNPFLNREGVAPEIWSYGHRNPQGLTVHPATGELWNVEHGPRGGDELNQPQAGKNYGWPVIVHGIDYPGAQIGEGITEKAGMEQPVYFWDPVIAPSGMTFYYGDLFPQWRGDLFVGALGGQMLNRLRLEGKRVVAEEPLLVGEGRTRIRDVRTGPDGALYLLTDANALLKITPP